MEIDHDLLVACERRAVELYYAASDTKPGGECRAELVKEFGEDVVRQMLANGIGNNKSENTSQVKQKEILPSLRMWAVVDANGNINHTTISMRHEDAVKEWMDQEHAVTRLFRKGPCPSWEGYEAEGYRLALVDIIPSL